MELLEKAYALFKKTDRDCSGDITLEEFRVRLKTMEMYGFFEALEISMARADDLFHLIDQSRDGKLTIDELVAGGLILQGPAKSIDLAALSKYLETAIEPMREDIQMIRTFLERR